VILHFSTSRVLLHHLQHNERRRSSRARLMRVFEINSNFERVWQRDFSGAVFTPSGILSLASFGPVLQLIKLERVVGSQWPWFGRYGDELLTLLLGMSIPPAKPKPRGKKRSANDPTSGLAKMIHDEQLLDGQKQKRCRTQSACHEKRHDPTPVNTTTSPVCPIKLSHLRQQL
jgi:hypothetical protein